MKRLFNLMLAGLLMVTIAACGKQKVPESSADKAAEQYGQTESGEITEQAGQEKQETSEVIQTEQQTENDLSDREEQQPQIQEGDNTVTGDISFNFETRTVLLNSGYEMPMDRHIQLDRRYLCGICHDGIKQRSPFDRYRLYVS